jgi:hypothetical protein
MNALWDRGAVASRSSSLRVLAMLRGARSGAVIVAANRKSSSGQSRPRETIPAGTKLDRATTYRRCSTTAPTYGRFKICPL